MGAYYNFWFVKYEGFREVVIESGLVPAAVVEGMTYDEIVGVPDLQGDIGGLLRDKRASRHVEFTDGFAKSDWFDQHMFKPFMPAPFLELVLVEVDPRHYIEGKDIDAFLAVMRDVYDKVKAKHDAMADSEEKDDLESCFLRYYPVGLIEAQDAIREGFCDRIVIGCW